MTHEPMSRERTEDDAHMEKLARAREQSSVGTEQWDPEEDPFACSLCGGYLNESQRVAGEDYCRDCRREGSA